MFFVQINHTGKGFLFLIFREIKLRKYSSLHKLFYGLSDPTFVKLISNLVKQSKHLIGILNLFKLDNEYYAFIKYNAGLSDEGTLYKYSNNKLTKICTLDSGKIVGLQKVK